MQRKEAARYASQPAMNIGGGMGSLNRFSSMFPFGPGTNLMQAAGAAQAHPNPAAKPTVPQGGLATEQGVMQALQKAGARLDWLSNAVDAALGLVKRSDVQTGGSAAPGSQSKMAPTAVSSAPQAGRMNTGMRGGLGGQGQQGSQQGLVASGPRPMVGSPSPFGAMGNPLATSARSGWQGLAPTTGGGVKPGLGLKMAMMTAGPGGMAPQPGMTANMPPPPGPPGMAAPPPPADPSQMPVAPPGGGAPPPGGMAPAGGDPAAMGGAPPGPPPGPIDPQTGQPVLPPMSTPPAPPLPSNPRPPQSAYPKTSDLALREASMLKLLESGQQQELNPTAEQSGEDLAAQGMAMGTKAATFARAARFAKKNAKKKVKGRLKRSSEADGFSDMVEDDTGGAPQAMSKGWQWRYMQREADEGLKNWLPRLIKTKYTPVNELLASPGKSSILGGLGGAALGGIGGFLGGHHLGLNPLEGAGAGLGAGALLGGVGGYAQRRRKNDEILAAMRHLPPGATLEDLEAYQNPPKNAKNAFDKLGILQQAQRLLAPVANALPRALPINRGAFIGRGTFDPSKMSSSAQRIQQSMPGASLDQMSRRVMDQAGAQGVDRVRQIQLAREAARRIGSDAGRNQAAAQQAGAWNASQQALQNQPQMIKLYRGLQNNFQRMNTKLQGEHSALEGAYRQFRAGGGKLEQFPQAQRLGELRRIGGNQYFADTAAGAAGYAGPGGQVVELTLPRMQALQATASNLRGTYGFSGADVHRLGQQYGLRQIPAQQLMQRAGGEVHMAEDKEAYYPSFGASLSRSPQMAQNLVARFGGQPWQAQNMFARQGGQPWRAQNMNAQVGGAASGIVPQNMHAQVGGAAPNVAAQGAAPGTAGTTGFGSASATPRRATGLLSIPSPAQSSAGGKMVGPPRAAPGDAYLPGMAKQSEQADTSLKSPNRSASGESSGLTFAHREDDHAIGPAAWQSLDRFIPKKLRAQTNPYEGKHGGTTGHQYKHKLDDNYAKKINKEAELTPFAAGFFRWCDMMNMSSEQIKAAVDKAAAFGSEVANELRAGLEKTSGAWDQGANALRQGANWIGSLWRPAAAAARPAATGAASTSRALVPVASQTARATGTAMVPYNPAFAAQQAARTAQQGSRALTTTGQAGAAAATNPTMWHHAGNLGLGGLSGYGAYNELGEDAPMWQRMGMAGLGFATGYGGRAGQNLRMGGPLRRFGVGGPAQALMGRWAGSGVGMLADAGAQQMGLQSIQGYDEAGNPIMGGPGFQRLFSTLGTGVGALRGMGTSMGGLARVPGIRGTQAGRALTAAGLQTRRAGEGMASAVYAGPRAIWNAARGKPIAGVMGQTPSMAGQIGRVAGLGGLMYMGGPMMMKSIGESVGQHAMNSVAPQMGQMADQVMNVADERMMGRLGELGLLDQNGQFSLQRPAANAVRGGMQQIGQQLGQATDPLFRSLGLDPSRMSGAQRALIMGGSAVGLGGAATGNPMVAGAGGTAAAAGLLPYILQNPQAASQFSHLFGGPQGQGQGQGQQPGNQMTARNEWEHQLNQNQGRGFQ